MSASVRLRLRTLDPLRLSLFALTIITISRIHQQFAILGRIRPALLLVGFAAVYALLQPRVLASGAILRTWPAKAMATLAVLAWLSAVFGLSFGASARFILEDYSKTLIYAFLLLAIMGRTRDLRLIVWAYVIACGMLVWMAVFVFGLSSRGSLTARLSGLHTYDANDMGLVLLVGLPLALLTLQTSRGLPKVASGLVLLGIGVALARSGSRGAFLGLLAVGAGLLISLDTVSLTRRLSFVAVVGGALVFAAPPGYWDQMRTMINPTEDYNWNTVDGRKQSAERGLRYMMQYPVFGIGVNNFPRAEGTISGKELLLPANAAVRWRAAHNSFIQAGAEMGIPGLVVWSSLVFGGVVSMIRLRRRLPRSWRRGDPEAQFLYGMTLFLPVALIGFAVTSAFLSFAYHDPVYVLGALMAGEYVAVERRLQRERSPAAAGAPRVGVARPAAAS